MSVEDQGDKRKQSTDEVSKVQDNVKTERSSLAQDKSRGNLFTVWMAFGIKVV